MDPFHPVVAHYFGVPAPSPAETQSMSYPNTQLFINDQWQDAADGKSLAVFNPATGQEIGRVAHAGFADLDAALVAAQKGFETWRAVGRERFVETLSP